MHGKKAVVRKRVGDGSVVEAMNTLREAVENFNNMEGVKLVVFLFGPPVKLGSTTDISVMAEPGLVASRERWMAHLEMIAASCNVLLSQGAV